MTDANDMEKLKPGKYVKGVGWWPFADDLDEYEEEIEASFARGEWRSAPDFEAEKERYEEIARATMATWTEEQLAEVKRLATERASNGPSGAETSSGLAGDGTSMDNPA